MVNERLDLPAEFRRRAGEMLGEDAEAFLTALAAPPVGLRVNTLRLAPDRFAGISPFPLAPLDYPSEGFVVGGGARPGRHPYHAAGLYYVQDPGAMAVGAMVDPRPGETVLDLAAAPGGKATHLAARMAGAGVLVANDIHPGRARELAGNLERFGIRNSIVTAETPARLAGRFPGLFDRVVVDAPCSGESMFHKSETARTDWSPASVAGCARRQVELMEQAVRLVRPGGLVVYSTCSFSPEENEETVARFLEGHPEFEMAPLEAPSGAAPGEPGWVPARLRRDDLRLAVRLWPHRVVGAGHFIAALRRSGGPEPGQRRHPAAPAVPIGQIPPPAAVAAYESFLRRRESTPAPAPYESFPRRRESTPDAVAPARLVMLGEQLHELPAGTPDLRGLRVISAGLWLGTFRKGRFDPSHSLAMALAPESVDHPVALRADDPDTRAYLRGETLRGPGPDGWTVVTVDGFVIGWGKRVRGVVKNHYPRGLRTRG